MASNAKRILEIIIAGKDQGARDVLRKTGDQASDTEKKFGGLSSNVKAGMVAAGAAVAAFAAKSVGTFVDTSYEVLKLQRYTGGTAEEMSKLRFAAQQTGIPIDSLTKGLGIMSKNLVNSKDSVRDFGVEAKGADGHTRPLSEILGDVADKFEKMPNGPEKTALAMKLFGRSGADLIPILNKGRDGLAELSEEAERFGVVLSEKDLQAAIAFKAAQRDLSAAWTGLQLQLGREVTPALTTVTNIITKMPEGLQTLTGGIVTAGGAYVGFAAAAWPVLEVSKQLGPQMLNVGKALLNVRDNAATVGRAISSIGWSGFAGGAGVVAALAIGFKIAGDKAQEAADKTRSWANAIPESERLGQVTERLSEVNDKLDDFGSFMGSSDGLLTRFIDSNKESAIELAAEKNTLESLKKELDETKVRSDLAASSTGALGLEQQDAADATLNHLDAAKQLNDQLRAAIDPLFAATNAMSKNEEAKRKVAAAEMDVLGAQKLVNDLQRNGQQNTLFYALAVQGLAEKQRALDEAQLSSGQSALDMQSRLIELKGAVDNGSVSMETAKNQLQLWVDQGVITQDTARGIIGQFQGVTSEADKIDGRDVSMRVTADTLQADIALGGLIDGINQIDGRVVQFTVATNKGIVTKGAGVGMIVTGSAGGGMAPEGPSIVGEDGPEMLLKRGSLVEIVPNRDTRKVLSGELAAVGGTTVNNYYVTNVQGSVVSERELAGIAAKHRARGGTG